MTKKCIVNVGGTNKESKPKTNVSGTWKDVKKGWVNVGGTWKIFYENGGGKVTTASVLFDATLFKTDPTGCLTYTGELAGKKPVNNTSTTLARATDEGDWGFDTTTGENMFGMYYCTFTSAGVRHQKLNPYDLSKYIATWDGSKWVAGSGSSSITTENTMLMIPTLYWKGESTGFTISSDSTKGTAYAHTIGGKTYKWLAIGVYCSYNNSSKAMSLSGKTATGSVKRADWRTYSKANTVSGGLAMQWNYYQWQLMRFLAYMSAKSFQCQGNIGQGGNNYSSGVTGNCNALGPYAGNISGTSNSVKCLIEDFWGYKYQFVDDCIFDASKFYAGQNAPASITDTASGKTALFTNTEVPQQSGFADAVLTGDKTWGWMTSKNGGEKIGLCDYQSINYSSSYYILFVGGYSDGVSSGNAGPGYTCSNSLGNTGTFRGARLAFVLD